MHHSVSFHQPLGMIMEMLFIFNDHAFMLDILDSKVVRKEYIHFDCHGAINEIMSKNLQNVIIIF